MSYKDMFRKEQRFSFRKFSFGLASAVIANVILGGAIANSPVVHANTVTEAEAAVAPANQDLGNETKTEEEPKEPIEAVRADGENRAAEILPEALNASVTNAPATIPTIGSNAGLPAKNNDAKQFEVLHVFGNVSGTTETESTKGTGAPDFNPSNATVSFPITDPENDAVTIKYKVPANFQNYIAGNPQATVKNDNETAETKNLGRENTNELLLNEQGRLVGVFPYNPGGLFSRIIELTDAVGNVSYSNPFYVIAYTDKRADNADLIVGQESDLTATNIFSKLKIDTTSGYSTTNQSLTVPETEYTRTIVGYRLTGTNDVQNLSADTLNTLPAGGNYEIKVKTTNQYGQTIYNWVPVNDTRTKEVSKEDLFVFNNSPIQTVDGTNKVKVVTVEDKDGVQAIDYYQTPNNQRSDLKGVTITPEAVTSTNKVEGYVTGTPAVDAIGYYTRSFGVTDAKGNLVITYPNVSGGEDNRQVIHVMDTNVTGSVTKQAGEIPTKEEILAKVTVNYGTPHKKITNPTSMYSMDLAPDQKVPIDPGEYDVKVRVVTASNVYKDVTVKVIIPKYSDVLTAKADENTSLVPGSGTVATQPITFTKEEVVDGQKTNVATTAPAGTAYAVEQKFLSEKQALGYEISVSETGEVSVKAPAGQEVDITVPVTVAYPDNSTDTVNVSFKVNQKDLAQIEAKKAIDDKLAEVIKELEAKRDVAIAEIDNNISLREEQKQAAKAAVTAVAGDALKDLDNKAIEAKEKIDKATTVSEINDAKTNGEISLDNAEAVGEKSIDWTKEQERAKAEVENKAFEALKKVNNNPNLSDDDKQAHFDDINATKETAIEEINNAEDTEEITAAIDKAEIAYNEDVINAAQLDALNKLEKDSEETKAAIDANPNLTPEEKAKAIAKVDELVNNAESDILSQPTPEKVQAVEDKADKDLAKVELQAAANDAKKGIEANPNLTPEEKDVAKKAVEDAVKVATDAIDKASTPAEVDTATSNGVKAIDAEEFKATQKDAKNKIAKEAESAKKAIDDNQNLTPDEKESAKNAVEEAAKVATDAIDKASTPNAVQAEEHKGVAAINLITAKADAKGAVAAKLADEIKKLKDKQAEAEKAIDASTMTNEEKAIAKKALQDVVDKGKADLKDAARVATNKIHEATTTEKAKAAELAGEKSLTDTGKEARDAVELAKDKELAKEAIRTEKEEATKIVEKLAEDTLKAIQEDPNLSDEAKEAEIKKLTDAVTKTLETIRDNADKATQEAEKAQALADLEKAKETQKIADKAAIDGLNLLVKDGELEVTKRDAKNKIAKDAAAAKEAIATNPNLTDAEKKTFTDAVDAEVAKANDAISAATSPADVQKEEDAGVAAIAEDVLDAAKQDAKNKIAKDAAAAKEAIATNPNLTDEAKEAAKKAVDTDAQTATDAIDKALKPDAVQSEEDKGVGAIAKDVLDAAKQDAKNKIAKESDAAKSAIDDNQNLTPDEKESAKNAVEAAAKVATDAIDKASTPGAVQVEEDKGVAAINLITAKADAKGAIAAKLADEIKKLKDKQAEAEKAIDASTMTDAEKAIAKEALQDAVDKGKAALEETARVATNEIHKATTVEDAKAATLAGEKSLTDTGKEARDAVELAKDKELAKEAIRTEEEEATRIVEKLAEDTLKAIKEDPNLSDEDKQAEIKKLTDVVTKTLETIHDNATKATQEAEKTQALADLEKAKETQKIADKAAIDGLTSLVKDGELDAAKQDAKNKIAKEVDAAKSAIDANPNLSDAEKESAKKAVDADAQAATDAIAKASTPDAVQAEEDKGVSAIATDVLDAAKQDAKNKIAKEAESAKSAIDAKPNLSDAEKESAKKAVDADAQAATAAIAKASMSDAVQSEEDKGVGSIAQDVLDAAKQDAKNKIAKEVDAAKSAIDSNPNLSDAEKEAAKKAVDADAKVATDAIDASTSPVEAQSAEDKGVSAIATDVLDAAKQDAKNKIAKEAESAKSAIDSNPNLTDADKESAKKAVDTAAQAATDAIAKASTPDAVQAEEDNGVSAIATDVLDAAKQDAKNKIAKEVDAAKSAIDANPNLSDAEKESAKKAVDADAQAATDAIDASTSPSDAQSAEDKGVGSIAQDVLDAAKQDAKNKIAKEVDAAKEAIDANPNLSDAEKESAKKAVDADAKVATDAIDASTSPVEAQSAEDKGVGAITKDVLDAAKQDAKNKIAKEVDAAKEAIDANPNLTDAEKEASKKAVDADAKVATDAIDASTSPVEAQSAEDKGVGAITKDVLDAAKQDAKNKIGKEAESAKSVIDSNPNLTDAAKEAAKSEIDKAVEEAIVLINGVRTHQELEKIKLPMAALIKPAAKVTPVVDPNNLTEKEIARIKAFLKENNNLPEGTEINVSKDASVTIKYPDGTIDLLSPVEVVKQADKTAPTVANDGKGNIVIVPSEKAVEIVVSYVDNNGKPQTVVVTKGTDGLWTASNTVVIVDPVTGQVIVPGSVIKPGTVVTAYSKDEVGNSSDSAEAEVVAVDENNSAAGVKVKSVTTNANNVEKKAKQLPNTGEEANSATSLGLVALGLGLALLAAKRRRDEEA
ncbi:DUF1542 domain-containing protein [Streptococcus suis]|uniref:DUF1542 domain-containing protein n=1 Tax=Streptococcus suis TaxID=1307 RepID=A0A4T2GZD7_STRSU|nr:DUF1542 domain-containing protein [Streptococcus suis]MBO4113553.1 DUF1542 domain-containing protein [Streptococcus suis]TII04933.1 DUF1542 domain-containing protein [Streptococcus suis]